MNEKNGARTLEDRIDTMHATGKIRMSRDRLATVAQSETITPDMLILISDVDRFDEALRSDPLFKEINFVLMNADLHTDEAIEEKTLCIHSSPLTGPVARGHLTMAQFERLIQWDCVEQVEEVTLSHME